MLYHFSYFYNMCVIVVVWLGSRDRHALDHF